MQKSVSRLCGGGFGTGVCVWIKEISMRESMRDLSIRASISFRTFLNRDSVNGIVQLRIVLSKNVCDSGGLR